MSLHLHINVDHIATLRNVRGTVYPDPVAAVAICLQAGAEGITAHLREDRRHIVDRDVERIRETAPFFNLEMAATEEMIAIAKKVHPDLVTLVPERREERTTGGGLNVVQSSEQLARSVGMLLSEGLQVSLFVEPDALQIAAAKRLGVQQIELHTGHYAHALPEHAPAELAKLREGARVGQNEGLAIAAGHGLRRENVAPLVSAIPEISELNIGHAVVADALFLSLQGAVFSMREEIARGLALRAL